MQESRLLDLFCELVRIESPSFHEAPMAARCADELRGLGFEVRFDDSAARVGSDTGNLVAHLPGTRAGHVVFSAHMDTVQPCAGIEPVVVDGIVRSAGDTILSADDKAGVAAILEGVRSVLEADAPRPDVTVLFTTCEEQHLLGSSALADGLLPAGAPCYVLDADGAPGTVITGAPCHWTLSAAFAGRAAHAGVCPEDGVSAIAMAAAAVAAMPLGRLDEATTANVGFIEGGGATNVVPDACTLAGECRSLYAERAEAQKAAMTEALEAAAARFGGTVDVAWTKSYDAVLFDEEDELVQAIARAARAAGLEPRFHRSGGGSDANILAARGVRPITLGVGMASFHSADEHIAVADLEGTARLVEALIAEGVE
ncbi:M20/M25/M40 family metallo-hydrolase [Eggerthella sp.]|uniref:M20/M25/M40 family metallo-hydrolase n=1 Tax=Eggerthella sp. TaxID=1929886 RepID=UPI003AB88B78